MWFIRLRKKLIEFVKFSFSGNKNKCLFLGTPSHKNLGDHAIVYAQYKFIRDNFENCDILEMSRLEYETYKKVVRMFTKKNTLIVVDGGGNLGTLWKVEDDCIRDVVGRFKKNPVMVFPQTAYYDNSEDGAALFERTVDLLNARDRLLFMFRDKNSYDMFKDRVGDDKILLCPDIVTYIDDASDRTEDSQEKKVGICFRDDKENIMEAATRERIMSIAKAAGYNTVQISTISKTNVYAMQRDDELKKKWKEFSECSLIITDRLHGMIFSAVTGTRCIAFDNISHKVSGGYEWLKELDYVQYCNGADEFENAFNTLILKEKPQYNREVVNKDYYKPLKDFISKV